MIYNIFDSGIYHKPNSVLKPKYQKFHYKLFFSGNDTGMDRYSMGMHRDLWMRKCFNKPNCLQNS